MSSRGFSGGILRTANVGTQTKISFDTRSDPNVSGRSSKSTQINGNRSVKTFIRMKGYPSARVRSVRSIGKMNVILPNLSKKRINFPTPKRKVKPKIDNKGIFIMHQPSPSKKLNHKMPKIRKATAKIDNRGIDIYKWRYSVTSLRTDEYFDQAVNYRISKEFRYDLKNILAKKLAEVSEDKSIQTGNDRSLNKEENNPPRRFSKASLDQNSYPKSQTTQFTSTEEKDDDFLSLLKRKLNEKLGFSSSIDETNEIIEDNDSQESIQSRRTSLDSAKVSELNNLNTDSPSEESVHYQDILLDRISLDSFEHEIENENTKAIDNDVNKKSDKERFNSSQGASQNESIKDEINVNEIELSQTEDLQANNNDRESSVSSSSTLDSIVEPTDLKDIDFDVVQSRSTSATSDTSSTKTILNVPGTPKIIVEDFRHRSDNGYNQISDDKLSNPSLELEKEDETVKEDENKFNDDLEEIEIGSIESNSRPNSHTESVDTIDSKLSSSLASSSTWLTSSLEYDVLEDGRPSYRLPQRSSSQKTVNYLSCFPWCCGLCFGRPKNHSVSSVKAKTIQVKEIH